MPAESSQAGSVQYADLRAMVGDFLGIGRTPANWSTIDQDRVEAYLKMGHQKALYPPPIGGRIHQWSFVERLMTIDLWPAVTAYATVASYSAGTGLTTLTAGAGTFYSNMYGRLLTYGTSSARLRTYTSATQMAVQGDHSGIVRGTGTMSGGITTHTDGLSLLTATAAVFGATVAGDTIIFGTSGNAYIVSEVVSTTQVTLTTDASDETAAQTFTISQTLTIAAGTYRLDDNYGAILSSITLDDDGAYPDVVERSEVDIRRYRSRSAEVGTPHWFAVRHDDGLDDSESQRFVMDVYPTPDSLYLGTFKVHQLFDVPSTASPFLIGGGQLAQVYVCAVLAEAEAYMDDAQGLWEGKFQQALAAGISYDLSRSRARTIGYMHDPGVRGHRPRLERPVRITLNDREI